MRSPLVPEQLIVDASAMVDLLLGSGRAEAIECRLRGHELHAPGHFDAEVLSAIGRLERAGHMSGTDAEKRINRVAAAPLQRDCRVALSSLAGVPIVLVRTIRLD